MTYSVYAHRMQADQAEPRPAISDPISDHDALLAGASRQLAEEQRRKARAYVASSAKDVEDCRTLLRMLGLIEQAS